MQVVPASTKIRYSRVKNIETERLIRRYNYLCANMRYMAAAADSRIEVRQYAREFICIERELVERGHLSTAHGQVP